MPQGPKKPKRKSEAIYCNKFNREFENGPHQKILKSKNKT